MGPVCYLQRVEERYQIAAVARMTGLSVDSLRAWERRYEIVVPERDAAGIRQYTPEQVARLALAREATELGHPIRRVAALEDVEIRRLLDAANRDRPSPESPPAQSAAAVVEEILAALRVYDIARVESLLSSGAMLLTPEAFVIDVLSVLMHSVGVLWELGRLSIAQEHIVSSLVRDFIGTLTRLRPPAGEETMLFATPPGELHEFGIFLAATLAAMRGVRVQLLGTSVPAEELLDAASHLTPRIVVLGIAQSEDTSNFAEYVAHLDRKLPRSVQLWVGGPLDLRTREWSKRVSWVATLDDFAALVPRYATSQYALRR